MKKSTKAPITPIRNERDYSRALKDIAVYFEHEPRRGSAEADRFDVLAALIEAYEAKRWPIDPPDAVGRSRMEQSGLGQTDLARLLGSRSRASEIMRRKRPLTLKQAWKLHREWDIPAEALLKQNAA